MDPTEQYRETYRLIVADPVTRRILCHVANGTSHLPQVEIADSERLAFGLCQSLRQMTGIETVALWVNTNADPKYAVLEVAGYSAHLPDSFSLESFTEVGYLIPPSLSCDVDTLVETGQGGLGRFARFGWLSELLSRFDAGELIAIQHWNMGIDFCLIRFSTSKGTFWFKAVGSPNTQEFANTITLARLWPQILPEIVLELPEWNGWISRHLEGSSLSDSTDPVSISSAIVALADLQIASIPNVPMLVDIGMEHVDARSALNDLPPFFDEMRYAMAAQTSTKSYPLSPLAVQALFESCTAMVLAFVDSSIPETLVHGDIGHGNIVSTDTPKFLDWCETWIAHPFIGAEYLFADLRNSSQTFRQQEQYFRKLYFDRWSGCSSSTHVCWARDYAPPFAALMFALVLWRKAGSLRDRTIQWPALRSLLREIERLVAIANGRGK